ncbi:MAG: HDIG domain-containing protein [Proteobacteria bacterium]|nr:HDIG domain-containing protein [Desulfobacula sp.]MBU4133103.1 HDIG domain-containing protein [Pseudomonadota bacterium]
MTPSITINEFKKSLRKNACLLDVRRKTDVQTSGVKIPGAVWQDPETIDTWITQLSADQPILVYCVRGGSVSQSVTDRLCQKGLNASFLEGGINGWMDSNQDIVKLHIPNKAYEISREDMDLLHKAKLSDEDMAHSLTVARKALEIAGRTTQKLDMELVGRGALFHDLGKAQTHEIHHGELGAQMGKSLGLPKKITDVMEKHIRGGMTPKEAIELGLPVKDYTLGTLEERIIIYADRLVDIITEKIVPIKTEKEAEDRFEEILKTIPKYGKNDITLERYLGYHREIRNLPGV